LFTLTPSQSSGVRPRTCTTFCSWSSRPTGVHGYATGSPRVLHYVCTLGFTPYGRSRLRHRLTCKTSLRLFCKLSRLRRGSGYATRLRSWLAHLVRCTTFAHSASRPTDSKRLRHDLGVHGYAMFHVKPFVKEITYKCFGLTNIQ
jgi:hypothetical protein